jgi:hypothetical protein
MAGTVGSEGVVSPGGASARDSSRIHQRQCERCHRWFWAWHLDRQRCFLCDPLPAIQLRAVLDDIERDGV